MRPRSPTCRPATDDVARAHRLRKALGHAGLLGGLGGHLTASKYLLHRFHHRALADPVCVFSGKRLTELGACVGESGAVRLLPRRRAGRRRGARARSRRAMLKSRSGLVSGPTCLREACLGAQDRFTGLRDPPPPRRLHASSRPYSPRLRNGGLRYDGRPRWTSASYKVGGEVQVDPWPAAQDQRVAGLIARPHQLLEPPAPHRVSFGHFLGQGRATPMPRSCRRCGWTGTGRAL